MRASVTCARWSLWVQTIRTLHFITYEETNIFVVQRNKRFVHLHVSPLHNNSFFLSLFWDVLERRLWAWGVSHLILTPRGSSSKTATHRHSGWTRPKNSSAVTCRLCRTGGVHQVCRLQTVWTLSQLWLFLFFRQTGHDFTSRRAGCFPSCCCSSQGVLILRVTMKSRQHFYLFLQFSSHNNQPVTTDHNLQLVSVIIRLKTAATKCTKWSEALNIGNRPAGQHKQGRSLN